jgi:hypothetical protein
MGVSTPWSNSGIPTRQSSQPQACAPTCTQGICTETQSLKTPKDSIACRHRSLARREDGAILGVSCSGLSVRVSLPAFRSPVDTLRAADARLGVWLAQAQSTVDLDEALPSASNRRDQEPKSLAAAPTRCPC